MIDAEPPVEELRPMLGLLAELGIESGRPFAPDTRMTAILEQAAQQGPPAPRGTVHTPPRLKRDGEGTAGRRPRLLIGAAQGCVPGARSSMRNGWRRSSPVTVVQRP
ncbi:hypothetical protein AB0L50_17750 [Streptomyces flaveolus]|uniref:hypothetical protein n=1 Tax=Streptomyces flaveolus TaxID=67297 RepID=UPI00341EAB3C